MSDELSRKSLDLIAFHHKAVLSYDYQSQFTFQSWRFPFQQLDLNGDSDQTAFKLKLIYTLGFANVHIKYV